MSCDEETIVLALNKVPPSLGHSFFGGVVLIERISISICYGYGSAKDDYCRLASPCPRPAWPGGGGGEGGKGGGCRTSSMRTW